MPCFPKRVIQGIPTRRGNRKSCVHWSPELGLLDVSISTQLVSVRYTHIRKLTLCRHTRRVQSRTEILEERDGRQSYLQVLCVGLWRPPVPLPPPGPIPTHQSPIPNPIPFVFLYTHMCICVQSTQMLKKSKKKSKYKNKLITQNKNIYF